MQSECGIWCVEISLIPKLTIESIILPSLSGHLLWSHGWHSHHISSRLPSKSIHQGIGVIFWGTELEALSENQPSCLWQSGIQKAYAYVQISALLTAVMTQLINVSVARECLFSDIYDHLAIWSPASHFGNVCLSVCLSVLVTTLKTVWCMKFSL